MLIKEMRHEDKPRERFAISPKLASNTDLVAILLRTGRQGHSVMELAKEVVDMLESTSGINGYEDLNWRDLIDIKGIGPDKAVTICAAVELGRRLSLLCSRRKLVSFSAPDKVAAFFMEKLRHENQEHFVVSYLNVKNRLLGYQEISKGNLNAAPVDIKEAMKWGIRFKAYGMILLHNHPSGYPEPSKEDIEVTKTFAAGARLLDMQVLDHVIIGDGTFVSLHERGII
jgi:DNA repair protein RadC